MAPAQVEANQPAALKHRRKRARETLPTTSIAERNVKPNCDLDLEILECPICTEHLASPVYQCQNGHSLCSACHVKIANCPSCSEPIGDIRCLMVEKIMDSLQVRCVYASHGCNEILKYSSSEEHTKNFCEYRPCPCIYAPECIYEGPKQTLPQHLIEKHKARSGSLLLNTTSGCSECRISISPSLRTRKRYVVLKDVTEKVQLLFHLEVVDTLGEIYCCTSFGDHAMSYDLKVWFEDDEETYTLMANALAEDIRWRENWKKKVLIFPRGDSKSLIIVKVSLHHNNKQKQDGD